MYHETFAMFAAYNRWANERLYDAVASLPDEDFRDDRGLFFGSIMGTLNHILCADRIWMKRFTGTGEAPDRLDAILFDSVEALRQARGAEDERIAGWIGSIGEEELRGSLTYRRMEDPTPITQALAPLLFHIFNHQTHHRGQCHAALTGLGRDAPSLDLVQFQRERH